MGSISDPAIVIDFANRFEAIATDGFEGKPYKAALADLAGRVKATPGLALAVAHAVDIMAGLIEDTDPQRRFPAKVAILREAAERLRALPPP